MRSRSTAQSSRTSKVFLHIGAPMTGSSFLRECMARHRRRLTRFGVLYPPSHLGHDGGHLDAVLDVLDLASTDLAPSTGAWDRLAETSRDWRRGTVVVSHELLADATEAQVERVVASFGDVEVHVVYAVRGLGRQIPLAWQEWVRNGGTAPFPAYVNRVVARDPQRMSRVFWQSHDIGDVLRRWSTYVPAGRVHALTVPAGEDQDAVLWDRFASTVGIDPHKFKAGAVDEGRRLLGLTDNEVLRLLNVEAGRGADPYAMQRVRRALGSGSGSGSTPALPVVHQGWLRDETDRQVSALKDGGYDVVGDVSDLVPEPDVFAASADQVTPDLHHVVLAQTRLIGSLADSSVPARGFRARRPLTNPGRDAERPAGLRQRARRGVSRATGR